MKKVLIYRRGGLGDTLLTFPIADIFKRKGYEVHFSGNIDYLSLGKEVGFIDRIYSDIPTNLRDFNEIILFAKENFLNLPRVKVVNPFPPKGKHVLIHYLESLNFASETFERSLPIKPLSRWRENFIIHPGSGSKKKNAPLEFFKSLYKILEAEGLKPLFVLGEAERYLQKELKNFNTYLVEDLVLYARLLKGSKGFLGNDSGFSHLAGYLGVPTFVLFGPTNPLEWKPMGDQVRVFYKNLECSPCFPSDCFNPLQKVCLNFCPSKVVKSIKKTLEMI